MPRIERIMRLAAIAAAAAPAPAIVREMGSMGDRHETGC
jgi:hypothetical protein